MDSALAGQPNTRRTTSKLAATPNKRRQTGQEPVDWAGAGASMQAHMGGQRCQAACMVVHQNNRAGSLTAQRSHVDKFQPCPAAWVCRHLRRRYRPPCLPPPNKKNNKPCDLNKEALVCARCRRLWPRGRGLRAQVGGHLGRKRVCVLDTLAQRDARDVVPAQHQAAPARLHQLLLGALPGRGTPAGQRRRTCLMRARPRVSRGAHAP